MPAPHSEPAPCPGNTIVPSGKAAKFCTLRYSAFANSRFSASPSRSGRPTDPINRKSPLKSASGSPLRSGSDKRKLMCSGVCPGVCIVRSVSFPNTSSSPSRNFLWANVYRYVSPSSCPLRQSWAPLASAKARAPDAKSAWICVSSTYPIRNPLLSA
jgi:hypothetical protein